MHRVSVFITTYSSIETFASIKLIFCFNRMNSRSKQTSIELTGYQISNGIDRLDPTDQKDNVRTESQLRVALILSERDNEFVRLRSHLVPEYGARERFVMGTNVNTHFFQVPTPEFGHGPSLDLVLRH